MYYKAILLVYNSHCITVQSGWSMVKYGTRTNFNGTGLLYASMESRTDKMALV